MRKGSRYDLLRALEEALDNSEYCATYGDAIWTHAELLERLREQLGNTVANVVLAMFGPDDEVDAL